MRSTLLVKILHLNTLKQDVQPDTYAFYLKFNATPQKDTVSALWWKHPIMDMSYTQNVYMSLYMYNCYIPRYARA
jgi:hypothetical protein